MRDKFNDFFFGELSNLTCSVNKSLTDTLNALASNTTIGGTNLDDDFYPLSDKLAYKYEPRKFGSEPTLQIRYIAELERKLVSNFSEAYPHFIGTLNSSGDLTELRGTTGFSTLFHLRSLYGLAILILFSIIGLITPEFQNLLPWVFIILTILSAATFTKYHRIRSRIKFLNEEVKRILKEQNANIR